MDRRVTPVKRVINYLTYLGSPYSMALRFNEISPRSLSSRSDLSGRNIFHLARTDPRDITNLAEFLVRSLYLTQMSFISARSRRDLREITNLAEFLARLVYLAEISFISARSRLSRRNILHLGGISWASRPRSLSSRADLRDITKSRRDLVKNSARSRLTRRDLRVITNFAELLARSRRNLVYLAAISETLQISPSFSLISTRSLSARRDDGDLIEISLISATSRRDCQDFGEISVKVLHGREVIYQIREGVFHLISKHQEVNGKSNWRRSLPSDISKHREVINQTREGVFHPIPWYTEK